MGLLQMAVDAWLGTTGFALARRSGVFLPPQVERVQGEVARDILKRYLQVGETSVDGIEQARELLRTRSVGGPGAGAVAKNALRSGLARAEDLMKQLRRRVG
mmetsp:Transcript_24304/g.55451  ORF Transcript_24304/g.55451 Transcript_24304/m.55451 type:complete len:102 (+) Transcript_24304:51-356(+)